MAVGLAVVMLLPVASAASAHVTAPETAPQLSIAVSDRHASATEGDSLGYAITVKNLGGRRVTGLHVTQTVPTGLLLRNADTHGVSAHGKVSWRVNLRPGSSLTLHTTMKVQATPKDLLRIASVACAGITTTRPIVCATDSDQLPSGATAAGAASPTSSGTGLWIGALSGLVVVAGGLGALVIRRRRHPGALRAAPRH